MSVVYVTASSTEEARRLAHALVQQKLVACVNILPGVESIYEWQGKLESSQEVMLVIKVRFFNGIFAYMALLWRTIRVA